MEPMDESTNPVLKATGVFTYLVVAAKIIVYTLLMMFITGVFSFIIGDLLGLFPVLGENRLLYNIVIRCCMLAGVFISAFILLKYWDHLPFSDLGLSLKGRSKDIMWGMLTALILYVVGFGILLLLGEVEVTGVQFQGDTLLMSWIVMLLVGILEETMSRGFVLGRLLNAGINRFVALFLSAALFSLMHFFNPNFSFIAFLNILLAGLLLGATYIYTRNLWFPIVLHIFWNWLQGPIFGFAVSGGQYGTSLLTINLPEKNIINGGDFGFEGSIVCTALMIIATVIILKLASRQSASDPYLRSTPEPEHVDE